MAKKNRQKGRQPFLETVMDIFVVAVMGVHWLVFHDYYFDILPTKYRFFCACSITLFAVFVLYGLLTLQPRKLLESLKGRKLSQLLSPTDWCVLAFILIAAISTVFSPFRYEAFWGNEGRYSGLFILLLYTGIYFCMTRCCRLKNWHIQMFLAVGMFVCLFGITDFFDLDLFHFKENIRQTQRFMFTSTLGNINTYTAGVAMIAAVAAVMFAGCDGIRDSVWYGICTFTSFVALIMGESDNAYLSLTALFGFLPLYLFHIRKGLRKYLLIAAMFFSGVKLVSILQTAFHVQGVKLGGLFQMIVAFPGIWALIAALWAIPALLYGAAILKARASAEKTEQKAETASGRRDLSVWFVRGWWVLIGAAVLLLIFVLYDVNIAGNGARYGALEEYLLFSDNWGTQRGYVWRIAVEEYMKFDPFHKIFGSGPDTFALLAYFNHYEEMASLYAQLYDSAHNELLQYFVTVGPLGLAAYLGIFVTSVWNVAKKKLDNPAVVGAMFAVICYQFQGLVNIAGPIVTPIMWMLLCLTVLRTPEQRQIGKIGGR